MIAPVPGFWIGGPLGLAAIVLALRARREPIGKTGRGMALIVFTNRLADGAGTVVGRVQVGCIGSSTLLEFKLTCSGVMTLPGGTLTLQGMTSPGSPTTHGATTGGTGAYADARRAPAGFAAIRPRRASSGAGRADSARRAFACAR